MTLAGVIDAPFLDTAGKVETLFLATLSRKPRPEEAERLVKYVDDGGASKDQEEGAGRRVLGAAQQQRVHSESLTV